MKWLWAAYRRGVFDRLPEFPQGMDTFQFQTAFLNAVSEKLFSAGGEIWLFIAPTVRGEIPIGMVNATPSAGHLQPHVVWFPEASGRNKMECTLKWLVEMKKTWKIDIWANPDDYQFFWHLCKYGVLRTVGKYRKFFPNGHDAYLFQSVT
jgi:hypothetical protein